MKIESIDIINFRNYDKVHIEFKSNLNIIYGLNGAGKTNLVEAIYLLSLTKSFRLNNDKLLIRKGMEKATVEGEIQKNKDTSNYKVVLNPDGKKVLINNTKIDKISEYVSKINIILFHPTDTNLVTEAPSERRKLLNIEISSINKEYLIVLSNYNRILKQRNFYLRQLYLNGNKTTDYLDILTKKLIEYGSLINKYRATFCENINKYISKYYEDIFGEGKILIKYISTYNNKDEEQLLGMYKKYYSKELAIGKTIIGVHHDDIIFKLDGNNLKEWGSTGQRKNAIISFKLAELNVIRDSKGYYPILILDDLFSELDKTKINNIFKMLNEEVQTFITTTEIENISEDLLKTSNKIKIEKGTIKEEV